MSAYPFWSVSFDLRKDVSSVERRVLAAVAVDQAPDPVDLEQLHPVLRYYLTDWRRMLTDEAEPRIGTPVRLRSDRAIEDPSVVVSIEFCQHDDEHANGGWVFWLWVCRLVAQPRSAERRVIGLHGMYRGDHATQLIYVDRAGFEENGARTSFEEIESAWAWAANATWESWHP